MSRTRRRRLIEYTREFKQLTFNAAEVTPDLTQFFKDDWYIDAQIICPPTVILVLCREVEAEEKEMNND